MDAATPSVTVAIPTCNRAALLGGAVASALAQTFGDFELLILDDASTDETPTIAVSFDDPRVRYIRHPENIGMAANWNRGFELARGTYVSLLHDDDRWHPEYLELAMEVFTRRPDVCFVYSGSAGELGLEKHDRIFTSTEALDRLRRRNEVAEDAVLVRRAALLEVGGFSDRWPYSMDWATWLRMAARAPVGYLARTLGRKGYDAEGQLTARMDAEPLAIAQDRRGMLREVIPQLPLPDAERSRLLQAAMRSLAQAQLVTAWTWAGRGDRARALTEARFAFEIDRRLVLDSPLLVAGVAAGLVLPPSLIRRLDRLRSVTRSIFRRD